MGEPSLYHRFEGYDDRKDILDGSDEDVLVHLGGKPALVRIPGTANRPRARVVSCLLHGNEDSGYHAVLRMLREGAHYPFDLWVFIGNVRAASQEGWFAHRFLNDQEDFNRVWGLEPRTTRMRRCAAAVLDELTAADLEAAVDLHNNTGKNPYYAIVPRSEPAWLQLAGICADTALSWSFKAHTFMQALSDHCPAVAVECGMPGLADSTAFATEALRRFLDAEELDGAPAARSQRVFEMQHRVIVRPEVPFVFGGALTDDLELVLVPGLDGHNFGMLLAGTEIGHAPPGAALPLLATDMRGRETTDELFRMDPAGRILLTQDLTPVMLTTTVVQVRRDCLFYVARRRA
jgi:succinylglutamate desuccinylase